MSKIYKLTITLTLFTLVSAGLSILTSHQSGWQVLLVLLLPILWALWCTCVALYEKETRYWKLILLWALIDISVLLVGRLMMGSLYASDPKGGAELVWLMEFFPPILPIVLLSMLPIIGTGISSIVNGANHLLLPADSFGVLRDWVDGSILSAISSCLFAGLWFRLKSRKKPESKIHFSG